MRVGILGGGQLAQMLAQAAIPLGIEVSCFDTDASVCASRVTEVVTRSFADITTLRAWARTLDFLTYEWENVPVELVADLSEIISVAPNVKSLAILQDRWAEKRLFDELEIPVAPFRTAVTMNDVRSAIADFDYPVIAKTRTGGYDGKGQVRVLGPEDLPQAEELIAKHELIVEKFVDFQRECSIIGVRDANGRIVLYPLAENVHRSGILHTSTVLNSVSRPLFERAQSAITKLLTHLNYVGVLALELFVTGDDIFANEMAPRVHNSGHWSIEGAETSQFENHIRAVVGLPLGSTALRTRATMVNLVGTTPPLEKLAAIDGAAVHLYGKSERPGRKLGHVTVTAASDTMLAQRVAQVTALL